METLKQNVAAVARRWLHRVNEWRFRNQSVPLLPLKFVSLAVTNICNAKCVFCAYPKTKLRRGVMTLETAVKAMELLPGKSVDMTPTVGDPLIDRGLADKIRAARSAGFERVSLTTNAILPLDGLIDAGATDVFFSLPSFDRDNYAAVYGVDKMPDVLHNVLTFLRENREKGEPCKVRLRFRNSLSPETIKKSFVFRECIAPMLSRNVTFNFTPSFDNWGGTILPSDMQGVMKMEKPYQKMRSFCNSMNAISVRWDGQVRACGCRFVESDEDDLLVGHIDDGILSLNEKVCAVLEKWKRGQLPKTCRNCSFYNPQRVENK
jgi:radical SAM protein with 4Fe4S-binding SPASM domain